MTKHTHPKALPFLCLTEMWERFGFYVVQGMLVLYMTQALQFSDDKSYMIMGAYWALAYLAPFAGGTLADRLLGFKTSTLLGAILLSSGYAILALWPEGFYLSLAIIIIGNGLLKPSISSLLGSLYAAGDPQRESGFTLFYIGINFGALLAGFSSGYIKTHFGWHAGFMLASVGLIIGIITFCAGLKHMMELQHETHMQRPRMLLSHKLGIALGALIVVILIDFLLQNSTLSRWILPIGGLLLLLYIFFMTLCQEHDARQRMWKLNILIISSVIFWMIYMQMFFSYSLFIDRLVQKNCFGFHIPTTAFYGVENLFIVLLGPLFAYTWQRLNKAKRNPSSFIKFVFAILFAGVGALMMYCGTFFADTASLINPLWVVAAYFFVAFGEMLLSPIGLSAVTTLAPRNLIGMMMGVWFVALGFGGQFAGMLAKLSDIPEEIKSPALQLLIYRHAFCAFATLTFASAIILFTIHLFLRSKR